MGIFVRAVSRGSESDVAVGVNVSLTIVNTAVDNPNVGWIGLGGGLLGLVKFRVTVLSGNGDV